MRIRADIQGLRAVAVLLVALNHAGVPGLSGGYIGVDVFFVVSGFLITSILLSDHERHGRVSFARFYARRARRILPAASVVLLATLLASWRLLDYVRANDVVGDVVWAAFFGANLRFAAQDTDYFAADLAPSPVQHFWSLAVEEQFYLLWPVLLAVVLVARRRRLLATVLVALCLASLCWSVLQTPADPMSAYFSTLTRGYELGAGALLAVGAGAVARLSTQAKAVLGWSGLAAVLLAATTFGDTTPFPGYHALLPVLGTVAIIAGGLDGRRVDAPAFGAVALLGRRPLRWIGDVSYSLYLWHWPFLILAAGYAGGDLSLGTNLVLLAGAVAASALTFYLVENPFRRARTLAHNPRYALAMWPVAISTVVVAGLVAQASLQSRPASAASLHVDPKDVPKPQRAELKGEGVRDEVATAVNAAALGKPLPSPVEPALADLRDDRRTEAKGCDANVEDTRSDLCPVGDTDADRTMVVLGDSHAAMWLPSIDALAKVRGWQVVPIVKYGCPPADVVRWYAPHDGPYTECGEWRSWALDQVERLQPDVTVVGAKANLELMDPSGSERLSAAGSMRAWGAGMRRTLDRLGAAGGKVRVLGSVTDIGVDPQECLAAEAATTATCTVPVDEQVVEANAATAEAARAEDARFVDVLQWFCAKGRCPLVIGAKVPYGDPNPHLTLTYARYLSGELADALRLPDKD